MKKIILASQSPRREELLVKTGIPFTIEAADIDETLDGHLPLQQAIEAIAYRKAAAILERQPSALVIGADTVVVIDHEVLGKPKDDQDAFTMLKKLSGKQHQVITAVAIVSKDHQETFSCVSHVNFFPLSDEEILHYIKTKEPQDKAGAYGIQGLGALFVESMEGDYNNIVGLPVSTLYRKLLPLVK